LQRTSGAFLYLAPSPSASPSPHISPRISCSTVRKTSIRLLPNSVFADKELRRGRFRQLRITHCQNHLWSGYFLLKSQEVHQALLPLSPTSW
jgi:hypothetical protein